MRKHLFIGALISLACLYFAFRGLSFRDVGASLRTADLRWIAAAMAVYTASFFLRAYRWSRLMDPIKPSTAAQLMRPMVIGFMANNILPFRMGELIRAHAGGQKLGISRTASLGTIVLERICDTISFLSIFLMVTLFFPFPSTARHAAITLGLACAAAIVVLYIASAHETLAQSWLKRAPIPAHWKVKAEHAIGNFSHGISGLRQGRYMVQALILSLIVWTAEGSTDFLIARAFPITISFPQAFFLLFFLGISVTIPQGPGYVGTVELAGVFALSLLGVPKNMALSVVLTIHACQFVFVLVLGLWALSKEKLSFSRLISEK
jgi:uncharacterized protein (TIRG00374 family)